jgi:hypothetical protein
VYVATEGSLQSFRVYLVGAAFFFKQCAASLQWHIAKSSQCIPDLGQYGACDGINPKSHSGPALMRPQTCNPTTALRIPFGKPAEESSQFSPWLHGLINEPRPASKRISRASNCGRLTHPAELQQTLPAKLILSLQGGP